MTYLTEVLADSPRHFWRCADGGGQLAHDVGSDPYHLLISASPLLGYSGPNSDGGSFLDNFLSNMNSGGATLTSRTSPFSAECWIWIQAVASTQRYILAWDGSTPAAMQIQLNTTGRVQAQVSGTACISAASPTTQHWHHIVATYDSSNIRLYVDGALSTTTALAGPVTINRPIGIGAEPGTGTLAFGGAISEIALYDTTLSLSRIQAHHNAADTPGQPPVYIAVSGSAAVTIVNQGTNPQGLQTVLANIFSTYLNSP